jgi:hypothetical protein
MFAGSKKSSKKEKNKNKGKKIEEFTESHIEIEPVENFSDNYEDIATRSYDFSQHSEGI